MMGPTLLIIAGFALMFAGRFSAPDRDMLVGLGQGLRRHFKAPVMEPLPSDMERKVIQLMQVER